MVQRYILSNLQMLPKLPAKVALHVSFCTLEKRTLFLPGCACPPRILWGISGSLREFSFLCSNNGGLANFSLLLKFLKADFHSQHIILLALLTPHSTWYARRPPPPLFQSPIFKLKNANLSSHIHNT